MFPILPKTIFVTVAFTILTSFGAAQDLEISLKLRQGEGHETATIEFEESFEVVIKNVSDQAITLPGEQSLGGMLALSFDIRERESGKSYHVHRKFDASAEGQVQNESSDELMAGESISLFPGFAFYQWGEQRWQNLPTPNFKIDFEIVAKFNTAKSERDIWRGEVKSLPIPFRFVFERAKLPQQYLWNGFPDAALRMLKTDPGLIHQTDEDQRTPLHVAARFNHPEVVRWLIDHKADTNAEAYNKFTPLDLAKLSASPEIYKLLLEAGADPHAKNAFNATPLQTVAKMLGDDRVRNQPERLKKWNEILTVFVEHGVKLDLVTAIRLGRTQVVKKLLDAAPEALDNFVKKQVHLRTAVSYGHASIVEYFLQTFPDQMDVDNFGGGSGYPVAIEALKHAGVLRLLIDAGADLERRITWQGGSSGVSIIGDNATLLHFAARDGTPETIQLLLEKGVDPFAQARSDFDERGEQTALDVACIFGRPENAIVILNSSAFSVGDGEQRQQILERCLALACRGSLDRERASDAKIVQYLLEKGADPKTQKAKQTLIQLATRSIHPNDEDIDDQIRPLIDILVGAGVPLDLYSAVAIRDTEAITSLLDADPTLCEARRADGYPAIHFAICCGELDLVKQLVAAGCDHDLKNHSKSSGNFAGRMMHAAAFWNQPEIAKFLFDSGAKVNVIAKGKVTPLHEAARTGSIEMVMLLLENGADIDAQDINGRTALTKATSPQVKRLLRDWIGKRK